MTEETMLELERRTEAYQVAAHNRFQERIENPSSLVEKYVLALDNLLGKMTDKSRRKCLRGHVIGEEPYLKSVFCEGVLGHNGLHSAGELHWPDRPRKEASPQFIPDVY